MKKQLLQESEIRKMMKFANIGALTDGFVGRLSEAYETDPLEEEDEALEEDDTVVEALGDELPPEDAAALGDELPPEDVEDELPPEVEEPPGELEISQEEAAVLVALGNRLEGELEAEPDLGAEDEMEMPAMDMEDEELEEGLVNEVLARVARRLKTSK